MAAQLTRKEAALFLGVKYTWLAKGACGLNASSTIPLIRYGKRVIRYDQDDLVKFAADHRKDGNTTNICGTGGKND